ncbi:hypothetical protein HAX54_017232 [Datura stramonium]|uniref:Uncharacterized protein n=1 Tax=Datura stramonium TaxID=4076 RepID=A0ABS8UML7_DATST|nr:hypothetical protein [Datura stramonium]
MDSFMKVSLVLSLLFCVMMSATTSFMDKQQSSSSHGCGRGRHSNGGHGHGRYTQGNAKSFNGVPQRFILRPRLPSILCPPPISYPASYIPSQPSNATIYCQLYYQLNHTAHDCPSLNSKAFVSDINSNYSIYSPGDAF